jgi:hypothetical protein
VEGNERVVRVSFRVPDDDGTLTDPTTVTFTARRRQGAIIDDPVVYVYGTDDEVEKESTGIFVLTFVPTAGRWTVHAQGTGNCHAAAEIDFQVNESAALA